MIFNNVKKIERSFSHRHPWEKFEFQMTVKSECIEYLSKNNSNYALQFMAMHPVSLRFDPGCSYIQLDVTVS